MLQPKVVPAMFLPLHSYCRRDRGNKRLGSSGCFSRLGEPKKVICHGLALSLALVPALVCHASGKKIDKRNRHFVTWFPKETASNFLFLLRIIETRVSKSRKTLMLRTWFKFPDLSWTCSVLTKRASVKCRQTLSDCS